MLIVKNSEAILFASITVTVTNKVQNVFLAVKKRLPLY